MKTITIDHVNLETREAGCNFCGQKKPVCVMGSVPFKKPVTETKILREGIMGGDRLYRVLKGDPMSIFGTPEEVIGYPDICLDCIAQMNALIGQLKPTAQQGSCECKKGC